MQTPTFSRTDKNQFFKILNKRVNDYFKEHNINKTGNWKLHLKAAIMFGLFFIPFFVIFFIDIPVLTYIFASVIIGIGMAGVGMNVMHDGNHGSFSKHTWVNKLMGSSIYILAGNVFNWKVQHNVLHHTYTNIPGHDEDLDAGRVIRFTKEATWYKYIQGELKKLGYLQYEISNYGKEGFESIHNQVYWDNKKYYGFGLGASGYINNLRSMSQGRAQYTMQFDHYDRVPQNVQDEVTKKMA